MQGRVLFLLLLLFSIVCAAPASGSAASSASPSSASASSRRNLKSPPRRASSTRDDDLVDDDFDDTDDVLTSSKGRASSSPSSSTSSERLYVYNMLHSVNNEEFRVRGTAQLVFSPQHRPGIVRISPYSLDADDVAAFKSAVTPSSSSTSSSSLSSSSFYRVAFVPDTTIPNHDLNQTHPVAVASIKACSLVLSNWREAFVFHTDVYGHLTSVDYRTPVTDCDTSSASSSSKLRTPTYTVGQNLAPKAKISLGKMADKVRNLFVSSSTGEGKQNEEKKEEPSFFSKYWMYIVPIGIILLLNAAAGAQPPEGAGGAGGGGGRSS